jgi:hypothetical protein
MRIRESCSRRILRSLALAPCGRPFDLPSVRRKKLTVDFAGGNQSSNGGLLLLRQAERKHGVCLRLAEAMPDRRDPDRIRHAMFEMVTSCVLAIACGHEDAIDLDRLRHDPLMKLAVGRCPESGQPLASQSTISRLENAPSKTEAARLLFAPDVVHHQQDAPVPQRFAECGGSGIDRVETGLSAGECVDEIGDDQQ